LQRLADDGQGKKKKKNAKKKKRKTKKEKKEKKKGMARRISTRNWLEVAITVSGKSGLFKKDKTLLWKRNPTASLLEGGR